LDFVKKKENLFFMKYLLTKKKNQASMHTIKSKTRFDTNLNLERPKKMITTEIKTLVGNKVCYQHSNYIFREGIVIEDAGEKVRVHWNKEFFKNPNTGHLISLQTWVSKSLLLASDWGYGKTIEPISSL
jgi:hypothetical protein